MREFDGNLEHLLKKYQKLKSLKEERSNESRLARVKWLPSQQRFVEAYNNSRIKTVIFTGANQCGKSFLVGANILATLQGFQPWDGKARKHRPPVKVALLLPDYDSHAVKFLTQNIYELYPRHKMKIQKTQQGSPRVITFPEFGNSLIHIFTSLQEPDKLEGGTWHELWVDEPCPRAHFISLQRGVKSKFDGKTCLTMTPLSEPWIFDEIYSKASNLGGEREDIFAITAFPDENIKSRGGYLPDEAVEQYRASLSEEEKEARVKGRWTHLLGRVYKAFDEKIHVLDEERIASDISGCPCGVVVDPHDRLPFAIAWFAITPGNDLIFFDEWPNEPFEKLSTCDKDIDDYCEILESKPKATWRLIDPNYGNRKSVVNGLSIAEEFAIRGYPFITNVIDDLATGHKAVQLRLGYDKGRPISATNQPSLYVSKSCKNIIKSFRNYVWDDWRGKVAEGRSFKEVPKEKYKHFCDCFDTETEIFTDEGWKRFDQLHRLERVGTLNYNGFLEFQNPEEYIEKDYSGEMIRCDARGCDFLATPNHRMLVYPQSDKFKIRKAGELRPQDRIPVSSKPCIEERYTGKVDVAGSLVDSNDWCQFLGWYVTEGWCAGTRGGKIKTPGRGYQVGISQYGKKNLDVLFSLMKKLPWNFKYNGVGFICSNKALWEVLRPLGNSYEKHFPDSFFISHVDDLRDAWESMVLGDGWVFQNQKTVATTSLKLAEDMTRLLALLGKRSSFRIREPGMWNINGRSGYSQRQYWVSELNCKKAAISNSQREKRYETVDYSGKVYCVSVPNETILVRRNYKPMYVGNCVRYACVARITYFNTDQYPDFRNRRTYQKPGWDNPYSRHSKEWIQELKRGGYLKSNS